MKLLCLLLMLAGAARARTYSVGDLLIPGGVRRVDPRTAAAMPTGCTASAVADLSWRWTLPEWDSAWKGTTFSGNRTGPFLLFYPPLNATSVKSTCHPTAWAWHRLLNVTSSTIAMGLNYCHHHAPLFTNPPANQIACNGTNDDTCSCSPSGLNKPRPWSGLDCSNLISWLLNFAFGFYPTSGIDDQACHPTLAPGRLLHNVTNNMSSEFLPGDLLYITPSRTGKVAPTEVSHVVMWTNYTVDFVNASSPLYNSTLLANHPSIQWSSTISCMKKRIAAKLPVYVLADSSNNGPSYRIFCGWYLNSFSHARRVIDPDVARYPFINDPSVAEYDNVTSTCMSKWKLSTASF